MILLHGGPFLVYNYVKFPSLSVQNVRHNMRSSNNTRFNSKDSAITNQPRSHNYSELRSSEVM